jgi:hypothetical protein
MLAMSHRNWLHTSRRPCPQCGGVMHYVPLWHAWLTKLHRRTCTMCAYRDPETVRME